MGPWAKECQWPPAAGKGTETESPLEPPEGIANCLALGPVTSRTVRE